MTTIHLVPPVAFAVVLGSVWLQSRGMDWFALKPKGKQEPGGKLESYACGEDVKEHKSQPNYTQFFHFAFFFTILHVIALIVATLPRGSLGAAALAVVMLIGATVSLFVLFQR
jgi:NADH:ubiquinone oxidoreductase subunit 3 (subunit A)